MKKIVCYGDSNTFGYNPKDTSRFNEKTRWTGILKNKFLNKYEIIEEGLNNRTGFVDNPDGFNHSGLKHFPKFIENINDIEIITIALGTNDLQAQFDIDFPTIEKNLENLINYAKEKTNNIIIIPPIIFDERVLKGRCGYQYDKDCILKSKQLPILYKQISDKNNCEYFDFNQFVRVSDDDGLHYDALAHSIIAKELIKFIHTKYIENKLVRK